MYFFFHGTDVKNSQSHWQADIDSLFLSVPRFFSDFFTGPYGSPAGTACRWIVLEIRGWRQRWCRRLHHFRKSEKACRKSTDRRVWRARSSAISRPWSATLSVISRLRRQRRRRLSWWNSVHSSGLKTRWLKEKKKKYIYIWKAYIIKHDLLRRSNITPLLPVLGRTHFLPCFPRFFSFILSRPNFSQFQSLKIGRFGDS